MHREFFEYAQSMIQKPLEKDNYEMYSTIEKGHGRIEERRYYLFRNLDWFKEKKQWIGLSGLLMTESRRMDIKKNTDSPTEIRLYITSAQGSVEEICSIISISLGN